MCGGRAGLHGEKARAGTVLKKVIMKGREPEACERKRESARKSAFDRPGRAPRRRKALALTQRSCTHLCSSNRYRTCWPLPTIPLSTPRGNPAAAAKTKGSVGHSTLVKQPRRPSRRPGSASPTWPVTPRTLRLGSGECRKLCVGKRVAKSRVKGRGGRGAGSVNIHAPNGKRERKGKGKGKGEGEEERTGFDLGEGLVEDGELLVEPPRVRRQRVHLCERKEKRRGTLATGGNS